MVFFFVYLRKSHEIANRHFPIFALTATRLDRISTTVAASAHLLIIRTVGQHENPPRVVIFMPRNRVYAVSRETVNPVNHRTPLCCVEPHPRKKPLSTCPGCGLFVFSIDTKVGENFIFHDCIFHYAFKDKAILFQYLF